MRWNEIVNEDLSVVQLAKSYIMDILAPLQAQGVTSITVQQIIDQLSQNPDLEGTEVQPDLIATALKGVDDVQIQPDPENMQLTVYLSPPEENTKSEKEQEKADNAVHSAAMRTITKNDNEGGL